MQPPPAPLHRHQEHGEKQHHGEAEKGLCQQALGVEGVNPIGGQQHGGQNAHAVLFRQAPAQEKGEKHRARRKEGLDKLDGVNARHIRAKHRHAQGEKDGVPGRHIGVRPIAPIAVHALGLQTLGDGDIVALVGAVILLEPALMKNVHHRVGKGNGAHRDYAQRLAEL